MYDINVFSVAIWTLIVLGGGLVSIFIIATIVYQINKVIDLNKEPRSSNLINEILDEIIKD